MQAPQPIIVHVVEEPAKSTTVGDVLIGSFGLVGLLVIVAVLLGLVLGGALIGLKLLRARGRETDPDSDPIHISPYT
jgi:hypothetical protein